MRITDVSVKLNEYGLNTETIETVIEQNQGKAAELLHNAGKLAILLQKVESLYTKVQKLIICKDVFVRIPVMCRLVRDYVNGTYTVLPIKSIIMIVIGLIYFVNPCDIVSDYIPIVGMLDDGFVLSQVLEVFQWDIQKYEEQCL